MARKNIHQGTSFDDFLEEEGLLEVCEASAFKAVLARKLSAEMELKQISKKAMAERLNTSRSQLDRLLDPAYTSVSLENVFKAAKELGIKLRFG